MKTRLRPGWFAATVLYCLSLTGSVSAGPITFFPTVQGFVLDTSGDVMLSNSTGPTVSVLADGFSVARSYLLDSTNNGNGTAAWMGTREFESSAITNVIVKISGDTVIGFGTGTVVFTVSATVFDANSGKVTTEPVFQQTLMPGITPVTWNKMSIIMGIQKSTAPFDDLLSLQSSAVWTNFNKNDSLSVSSQYAVTMDAVPEPSSWLLLSTSFLGLLGVYRRRTSTISGLPMVSAARLPLDPPS